MAQDEATSVVYGMPKEALKLGAVDKVVPLSGIPQNIIRALENAPKASNPQAKVG